MKHADVVVVVLGPLEVLVVGERETRGSNSGEVSMIPAPKIVISRIRIWNLLRYSFGSLMGPRARWSPTLTPATIPTQGVILTEAMM